MKIIVMGGLGGCAALFKVINTLVGGRDRLLDSDGPQRRVEQAVSHATVRLHRRPARELGWHHHG